MSVTRRLGARAAAFVVAAAVASGVAVSNSGALSAANADVAAPVALPKATLSETTDFVIAPTSQVYQTADRDLEVRLLLRNSANRTLPEGSVELRLEPPVSKKDLAERLASEGEENSSESADEAPIIATAAVAATEADSEQSLTVSVAPENVPLTETSAPGVYTVTAKYLPADGSAEEPLVAEAPVVWRGVDPAAAPVKVSLVVPFVLPSEISTMPTRSELDNLAPGFTGLLDFASASNAMLAIDPRIIAAIRGYGTRAPENSREFLERLEASPLKSFLLQYGDADVTPQAALRLPQLLQPVSFDFVTRNGSFDAPSDVDADADSSPADADAVSGSEPADSPETPSGEKRSEEGSDPDAADDSAEPEPSLEQDPAAPPTLEELGSWEGGLPATWPSQVTSQVLSYVNGFGLNFTVLGSDNVTLSGGPRAKLASGNAVVTDAELDEAVKLALSGASETERDLGLARAHALLANASEGGVFGLAIGVDRGAILAAENPVEVLESIVDDPWVRTVTIDAQTEGTAVLKPEPYDSERTELLGEALMNEERVVEVRAMLENPEFLDGYQRMRLLTLFSTRYADESVTFSKVADRFAKRDAEIREGVDIVVSKHAQLVGASSRIPVQLRNSLPFNASATVSITPTSAALALDERVFRDVLVANDSSDRVLVPVSSRVSSGESGLLISVTSNNGEYTAATAILPISISTTVEVIALSVLGAAAVLLFGFGIWRSVRHRRTGIARI